MKLKLDTIIIFVQNVGKLKSFYVDILALDIVEELRSEWLLMKAGNCNIGLHKIGDQYLDSNQAGFKVDSNTKVVFEIDEDIHSAREWLVNQNVSLGEIKTFENYDFWLCDGEDPEGNVFQLKQRKNKK